MLQTKVILFNMQNKMQVTQEFIHYQQEKTLHLDFYSNLPM